MDYSIVASMGAAATVVGCYFKLKDRFKSKVVSDVQPLLAALESRIALAEKEIEHIKKTHASEIQGLAKKLDELRDEVRQQHSQLIDLLMKFVPDPKKKS